jgi:NAD(P)H dehydrogenase (quinone)
MKANIVFAQPGEQSFPHEILHCVQTALTKAGITFTVRDLYNMNFQPVFTAADMHSVEEGRVTSDIEEEQQLITDADLLVMIYPIWWWSQPAILKGWIDRVFTNHFAFRYESNGPVGMLSGKRAIVFTTTRESDEEMEAKGYDAVIKKQIVDGTLSFVGFQNVVHKNFAAVPYVDEQKRQQMLREVETTISSIPHPVVI